MTPPIFVNYRRADEPFAAALIHAVLSASWAGDPVFLDTRFLRQRGDVERQLLDAVAGAELVLAVIGPVWDDPGRRERLADPADWVRRELVAAAEADKPVIPVLVDRDDVPNGLPFTPVPRWSDPVRLGTADFWRAAGTVTARVTTVLGRPTDAAHTPEPPDLIGPAVDAMLRHVLPAPQRRMRNDAMVARVVAGELDHRDWLRFVATANLPGRPNGSGVVWVTADRLGVVDLGSNFRPRVPPTRVRVADVRTIDRRDGRRLWKPISDVGLRLADGTLIDVRGFFAAEADELLEFLRRPVP